MPTNLLDTISAPPPNLDDGQIRELLATQFGISGGLTPLVSERDQNIRIDTPAGERYVLKVANAAEDQSVTDLQVQVLIHLSRASCPVSVPEIIPTLAGASHVSISGSDSHVVRLVSYVDGRMLREVSLTPGVVSNFGKRLAQLDDALQNFEHAGEQPMLLWDMQRALQLRPLLTHIEDRDVRQATAAVLDDFERRVLPAFPTLRHQVIHGDANPDNVLVDEGETEIAGFIDFGDMIRAPRVVEVAVAASYLRALDGDALQFILPFVEGYRAQSSFEGQELEMLFDLIRTRLATTISFLYWRLSARGTDDAYRQATLTRESVAQNFLARLDEIGRDEFTARLKNET
jgi:hydroxylysine kinase